MKRKIKTTMDDLIMAFEMNANEYSQYLNLETGGIAIISELGDSFDENGNEIEDVDEFISQLDDKKYLPIPGSESHEAFEDMEHFIDTVNSEKIKQELRNALGMRRPFYHFKDILLNYPNKQKRWFSFQEQAARKQIMDWLEQNNLELEGNDKKISNKGV
jgi:hypothetical protein